MREVLFIEPYDEVKATWQGEMLDAKQASELSGITTIKGSDAFWMILNDIVFSGYGDFCNQLADNPYGFQFQTRLFPAVMQGEGVEQSIIAALERIYAADSPNQDNLFPLSTLHIPQNFDAVVIIRGGGATSDMSGFDTLALAENVANFPLPVITGIGHDRDESILDMVSHTRVKTPTAAAAFLISHLKQVSDAINEAQDGISRYAQQKLSTLNAQLSTIAETLPRIFATVKTKQEARIDMLLSRLLSGIQQKLITHRSSLTTMEERMPILLDRRLTTEHHRLQLIEERAKSLDPALLLKRGYSITLKDGKVVRDAKQLQAGDEIDTRLEKGTIKSIIK